MALGEDLERIAGALAARGTVTGVLAAEGRDGMRSYLVSFGEDDDRGWLVVDDAAAPVESGDRVREVASVVVMCELAEDIAAGGDIDELRARLAQVKLIEQTDGIDRVDDAALALERAIGTSPRVASADYLDAVGEATRELERALGEVESPFASALAASSGAVDGFVREVEARYLATLD